MRPRVYLIQEGNEQAFKLLESYFKNRLKQARSFRYPIFANIETFQDWFSSLSEIERSKLDDSLKADLRQKKKRELDNELGRVRFNITLSKNAAHRLMEECTKQNLLPSQLIEKLLGRKRNKKPEQVYEPRFNVMPEDFMALIFDQESPSHEVESKNIEIRMGDQLGDQCTKQIKKP